MEFWPILLSFVSGSWRTWFHICASVMRTSQDFFSSVNGHSLAGIFFQGLKQWHTNIAFWLRNVGNFEHIDLSWGFQVFRKITVVSLIVHELCKMLLKVSHIRPCKVKVEHIYEGRDFLSDPNFIPGFDCFTWNFLNGCTYFWIHCGIYKIQDLNMLQLR
jgi:hypothetical protein